MISGVGLFMRAPSPVKVVTDEQKLAAETEIVEQSKRIDFYITEYSVELLANKMRRANLLCLNINVNPHGSHGENHASSSH
jgi:hypothetical protein